MTNQLGHPSIVAPMITIDKLAKTIKTFCESADVLGQYAKEIDINPVAIHGDTIMALDALIICK